MSGAIGLAAHPEFLQRIEGAHETAIGQGHFCYWPVTFTGRLWRLGVIHRGDDGYYPITEDFFMGDYRECMREARRLNVDRLGLGLVEATDILVSNLRRARDERRL